MFDESFKNIIHEEINYIINEAIKNISDNEIIVEKGTPLFHGTLEPFEKLKLRGGGFDNMIWTTSNSVIAQTYIPRAGSEYMLQSKSIANPTDDDGIKRIQKQFGIEYSDVEYEHHRPISYKEAPIFEKKSKEIYKLEKYDYSLYKKEQEFKKKADDFKNPELTDEFFKKWEHIENLRKKISDKLRNNNLEKYKNDYVNEKLKALGYKPKNTEDKYINNYYWRILLDKNYQIAPANFNAKGRLFILKPKRDLKIYDTTNKERIDPDLLNKDYYRFDWFEAAKKKGYDGIKINDFAQTEKMGNMGHTSIGLFPETIKDIEIETIPASHPDITQHYSTNNWDSPEYEKHIKSNK